MDPQRPCSHETAAYANTVPVLLQANTLILYEETLLVQKKYMNNYAFYTICHWHSKRLFHPFKIALLLYCLTYDGRIKKKRIKIYLTFSHFELYTQDLEGWNFPLSFLPLKVSQSEPNKIHKLHGLGLSSLKIKLKQREGVLDKVMFLSSIFFFSHIQRLIRNILEKSK